MEQSKLELVEAEHYCYESEQHIEYEGRSLISDEKWRPKSKRWQKQLMEIREAVRNKDKKVKCIGERTYLIDNEDYQIATG